MSDAVENLVLEHLRHLRGLAETTLQKINDLTTRMGFVEEGIASLHSEYAHVSVRLDRVDNRLDRIERRLDLVEA
jgi:hypothetical protein